MCYTVLHLPLDDRRQ